MKNLKYKLVFKTPTATFVRGRSKDKARLERRAEQLIKSKPHCEAYVVKENSHI